MIINNINEGTKVAYTVNGNKITFGDDALTLNLQKYERDEQIVIDICRDDNNIIIAGPSKYFVANITIPAKTYIDSVAQDFNMDAVKLDLWALIEED